MTKTQKFAIALIVITLLIVLIAINKPTSSPMEPLTLPAVEATANLSDAKNKIQGADKVLSPSHTQQVLQEIKKQCESPFYRASNPETCSKLK
jgi:hypothetical protein